MNYTEEKRDFVTLRKSKMLRFLLRGDLLYFDSNEYPIIITVNDDVDAGFVEIFRRTGYFDYKDIANLTYKDIISKYLEFCNVVIRKCGNDFSLIAISPTDNGKFNEAEVSLSGAEMLELKKLADIIFEEEEY